MAQNQEFAPIVELTTGATRKTPRLNVGFTVGDEDGANGITATIQLYEWQTPLAEVNLVRVWLSATAGGAPSAVTADALTVGAEIQEVVDHGDYWYTTDATGKVTVKFTEAGAATRYLCVAFGGAVFTQLLTWAA